MRAGDSISFGSQQQSPTASSTQSLATTGTISVHKIPGGHPLLAFGLHLEQFQRGSFPEADHHAIAWHLDLPGRKRSLSRLCRPHMQLLAAKAGERARPGLKSAQAVERLASRAPEVNP